MEYSNEKQSLAVDVQHEQHRYIYRVDKRIFDFVASLIGLVILSPVFLIVAIAIKLEDPVGPIFLRTSAIRQATAKI